MRPYTQLGRFSSIVFETRWATRDERRCRAKKISLEARGRRKERRRGCGYGRARTIINGTMHSGKSARDEITCCDEGEEISSARITFDYLQEEKRKKKRRKDELLQLYNVNCSRRSRYEEKFRIVFSSVGTEATGDS